MPFKWLIASFLLLLLLSCSGLEQSESKRRCQANLVVEPIRRRSSDDLFSLKDPEDSELPTYPWHKRYTKKRLCINQEFFRCKGDPLNPPLSITSQTTGQITYQIDCEGVERHSLPIQNGKEFIYPILIDLLNQVQEKTEKRVIITSGHRCRAHNSYVDPSPKNRSSKHLMGAEVDFYVEGMEWRPLEIITLFQTICAENPLVKQGLNRWSNRDLIITCKKEDEGRNGDNRHPYPYLSIELRIPFSHHLERSIYQSR